jgi:hypothetical protein
MLERSEGAPAANTRPSTITARELALAVALCLILALCPARCIAQQPVRSLSGTVTDSGREPLKGAVVEVVDNGTKSVMSYLTDRNGQFVFKRLATGTDYQFFATYRGHKSKTKHLGMFDNKTAVTAHLVVRLH